MRFRAPPGAIATSTWRQVGSPRPRRLDAAQLSSSYQGGEGSVSPPSLGIGPVALDLSTMVGERPGSRLSAASSSRRSDGPESSSGLIMVGEVSGGAVMASRVGELSGSGGAGRVDCGAVGRSCVAPSKLRRVGADRVGVVRVGKDGASSAGGTTCCASAFRSGAVGWTRARCRLTDGSIAGPSFARMRRRVWVTSSRAASPGGMMAQR